MAEDYTYKYNTDLPPEREDQFRTWLDAQSKIADRDMSRDLYDYDLRGYFARYGSGDIEPGHMTDAFKKPNHPTFSTESNYHGKDGLEGGTWSKTSKGWAFNPGATNLDLWDPGALKQYFDRVEPGNELRMPEPAK